MGCKMSTEQELSSIRGSNNHERDVYELKGLITDRLRRFPNNFAAVAS
jgi:hypothetical protein